MPKAKAHSGATKRFKKTGAGYKHKHANRSHKRKRNLRGTSTVTDADSPLIDRLLRS